MRLRRFFPKFAAVMSVAVLAGGAQVVQLPGRVADGPSTGPVEQTLYSFYVNGPLDDGFKPYAGVTVDQTGAIYGTTADGGNVGYGTVYKVTPSQRGVIETVLHSFTGGSDGGGYYSSPGELVLDNAGVLYGTTPTGGDTTCPVFPGVGCGVVYKLTPPATQGGAWTQSVLYTFQGGLDGAFPTGKLIFDGKGALYGVTNGNGQAVLGSGLGTVYKLTPPATQGGSWTMAALHSFTGGSDGANPQFGLVGKAGSLYGTTFAGGQGYGTVYQLTPLHQGSSTWTENVIHSFSGGSDGQYPKGELVFDQAGALYATTQYGGQPCATFTGCGVVFKLIPPPLAGGTWTETVLYAFADGIDGAFPATGVVLNGGILYGTNTLNQAQDGGGVAFQLTPPSAPDGQWTETTLYNFIGLPANGLAIARTGLYGTRQGGYACALCDESYGNVFRILP